MMRADKILAQKADAIERIMGDHLVELLYREDVTEVMVNPDGNVFVECQQNGKRPAGFSLSVSVREQILRLVADYLDLVVTAESPVVEGQLRHANNVRFAGVWSPISSGPSFCMRRPGGQVLVLREFVTREAREAGLLSMLEKAIQERSNILIAGGTSSGKTTLLNSLLSEVAVRDPECRLVLIEDTPEIQSPVADTVQWRTNDISRIDVRELVKTALRFRPDRIVVGEVRDAAALELLKAWNTGHKGGLGTVHANSALAALMRLRLLIQETGSVHQEDLVAEAVDLVVFVGRTTAGRKILEVQEVLAWERGRFVTRPLYQTNTLLRKVEKIC